MIEITGQKVFRDRCGPEAQKDAGSVAGFGAPAPPEISLQIRCFLAPIFAPKMAPKGSKIEPKMLPRRSWSQAGAGRSF